MASTPRHERPDRRAAPAQPPPPSAAGDPVTVDRRAAPRLPNGHPMPPAAPAVLAASATERPGGALVVDGAGTIVAVDRRLAAALGLPTDRLVGRPWSVWVHPDDAAAAARLVGDADPLASPILAPEPAAAAAAVLGHDLRLRHADGAWHWFEAWAEPAGNGTVVLHLWDVTRRVAALTASEAAARRGRAAGEHIPAIVYVAPLDPRQPCTYVGPQIERILGFAPQVGCPERDFLLPHIHPDDLPAVVALNEQTDRDGTPFICEYRVRAADGRWVWLHEESVLVAGDPEAPFWHGVMVDISAEKAAEEARRQAEAHLRAVVDHVPAIVYMSAPDRLGHFEYTFVSPYAERLLGYTPAEIVGTPGFVRTLIHPDDLPALEADSGGGDGPLVHELRLRAKDGRWVCLRDEAVLIRDDAGTPHFWQGVAVDVSATKEAEAGRRDAERHYRDLVEQGPAVITTWVVDAGSPPRLTFISPQVERLLGVTPAAAVAEPGFLFNRTHPDDLPRLRAAEARAIAVGAPFVEEFRLRTQDDRWIWVRDESVPIAAGEPRHWRSVMVDITEQKEAAAARDAAERQYQALVEQVPAIVYTVVPGGKEPLSYVSPQIERVLGYTPAEARAEPLFLRKRTHPDDVAAVVAATERALAGTASYWAESRVRAKDGRWVWLRDVADLVRDERGAPLYWHGVILDISERKAAAALLRANEARFRALIQHSSDVVAVADADGVPSFVGPSIRRALGVDGDDLVREGRFVDIHPDDVAAAQEAYRRVAEAPGRVETVEARLRHADGGWRWFETVLTNLLDDPAVHGVVLNGRDVGERKRAEAAVAAERDLLQTLIDTVPDLIFVKDVESRFVRINRALARVLGVADPAAAIGTTDRDFFPPAEAAAFLAEELRLFATGDPLLNASSRLGSLAAGRDYIETKVPLRDGAGAIVGLVGVSRDITDLRRVQSALESERDLLQTIMDTANDPIYVKDTNLRYVRVNRAQARLLGVGDPADAIGRRVVDLFPPALAEEWAHAERRVLETGQPLINHLEERDVDGERRWSLITELPLRDADGATTGLVGLARDVTELKLAEQELARALADEQQANRDLEAVSRAKSNFVSIVSHEFRTPLTSIQGFSELIRDVELERNEVRDFADDIHRSSGRLSRLIGDLLDFDRMQAAGLRIDRRPVDLNALARDATAMLRASAPGHRFVLDLDPGLPPVTGDADRLTQVLTNLLGNAVKYAPNGGVVEVATRRDGDGVHLSVRDDGAGIPPESLETIFEPYVRLVGGARRSVGTGLGLAITRELVGLHGGAVWAENAPGHGARFQVRLPAAVVEVAGPAR